MTDEDLEKTVRRLEYALEILRNTSQRLTYYINNVWCENLEQIRNQTDEAFDLLEEAIEEIRK